MKWPYSFDMIESMKAFYDRLKQLFADVGSDMQEQKTRVDNLVNGVEQPSEVVDMHLGRDSQTYPVARDMVLGEIGKTEAAQAVINADTAAQLATQNDSVAAQLADEAQQRQIKDEDLEIKKAQKSDVVSLQSQFNTLVANAGNTDGNAELLGIRSDSIGSSFTTSGDRITNIEKTMVTGLSKFEPGDWESGNLDANGNNASSNQRIRTANFHGFSGETIHLHVNAGYGLSMFYFDDDKNYIGKSSYNSDMDVVMSHPYYKFAIGANGDPVINVSAALNIEMYVKVNLYINDGAVTTEKLGNKSVTDDKINLSNIAAFKNLIYNYATNIGAPKTGGYLNSGLLTTELSSNVEYLFLVDLSTAFNKIEGYSNPGLTILIYSGNNNLGVQAVVSPINVNERRFILFSRSFSDYELSGDIRLYITVTNKTADQALTYTINSLMLIPMDNPNLSTDTYGKLLKLWNDEKGFSELYSIVINTVKAIESSSDDSDKSEDSWGDSLTQGAGGNGIRYPDVLQSLLGTDHTVTNYGVGGEQTQTIASRQGGMVMLVNNITIPADTNPVQIGGTNTGILTNYGTYSFPLRQGSSGVNPCYINGVKGTLSISQTSISSTDVIYYFTRETAGDAVIINRPTALITDYQKNKKRSIPIIWIGQNGGWNNDPQTLVDQYEMMIDYAGNKKYLVIGLTSGSAADRQSLEALMNKKFGRHYVNLRDYISQYGMDDAGLIPTSTDMDQMSQGIVPDSLRVDTVHFNEHGYPIVANQIYKRGQELGYW
ncbi:hypothetical protein ACFP7A_00775 [Sporolactobacillus kofuensis]|uniref:SGNH hydrolase-type esterase domain-containing protein n=1 Tax=Sporolactobacillus kofuensis TaxID=269672 RepID=A0ABW1WDE4_9BACL|nr:hypothetical protein [Sporolactobacillus kofuensis]MCO7175564.1 hypothetical protein [Sporolactobacillus kofuensis]